MAHQVTNEAHIQRTLDGLMEIIDWNEILFDTSSIGRKTRGLLSNILNLPLRCEANQDSTTAASFFNA